MAIKYILESYRFVDTTGTGHVVTEALAGRSEYDTIDHAADAGKRFLSQNHGSIYIGKLTSDRGIIHLYRKDTSMDFALAMDLLPDEVRVIKTSPFKLYDPRMSNVISLADYRLRKLYA